MSKHYYKQISENYYGLETVNQLPSVSKNKARKKVVFGVTK